MAYELARVCAIQLGDDWRTWKKLSPEQIKANVVTLRKAAAGSKYVSKDLRAKKTRAIRKALTKSELSKKTPAQKKKLASFPVIKFAVKA